MTPSLPVHARAMRSASSLASVPEQVSATRGEALVEGGGERLGVVEDGLVEIAGREVEPPGLRSQRAHHVGMAMADMGHVVVGVEVDPALAVPDPDPLPPHQVERPVVEERRAGAEQPVPAFEKRVVGHWAETPRAGRRDAGRDIGEKSGLETDHGHYGQRARRGQGLRTASPCCAGSTSTCSRGSRRCLVGPSSSGKSVLLKCLLGLMPMDAGHVRYGDIDLAGLDKGALERLMRGVGVLFQQNALFDSLSVWENVALHPHPRPGNAPARGAGAGARDAGCGGARAQGRRPLAGRALGRDAEARGARGARSPPSRPSSCWTTRPPASTRS